MNTANNKVNVATYQKAKKGNVSCGDSYFFVETENGFICAVADGLGSGTVAQESSKAAIDVIKANITATPEQIIANCNRELTGKRGVVLGILKLDFTKQSYSILTIGNIGVLIMAQNQKKKRSIPHTGYLASFKRSFKEEHGKLESNMNFVMFSDGVTDRELSHDYFERSNVDEMIKIYTMMNDKPREDDTTLIVMRYEDNKQ